MPRTKQRKTESHGQADPSIMKSAVRMVLAGESIRKVANANRVCKSTLHRYVNNARKNDGLGQYSRWW